MRNNSRQFWCTRGSCSEDFSCVNEGTPCSHFMEATRSFAAGSYICSPDSVRNPSIFKLDLLWILLFSCRVVFSGSLIIYSTVTLLFPLGSNAMRLSAIFDTTCMTGGSQLVGEHTGTRVLVSVWIKVDLIDYVAKAVKRLKTTNKYDWEMY